MSIITVNIVSKRYRLRQAGPKSIREVYARGVEHLLARYRAGLSRQSDEFFALRDVSFDVKRGEAVGFIGPNGAGKSTILKLLARITYPTSGKIAVYGSVASLIEVGAGFHPDLTGRENIYLYGSIMGMRRAEVRATFEQIVDFAELDRFIDTPVKHYSSGMYVRLGFAVAAHINPHVLLLDEVLAAADVAFQNKCLQSIEALRRGGVTIVVVSHYMALVERLCDRVFFLYQGRIHSEGEPQRVIRDYYGMVVSEQAAGVNGQGQLAASAGAGPECDAQIVAVRFLDSTGKDTDTLATGEPLIARIEYWADRVVDDPVFELLFYSADGWLHCRYTTGLTGERIPMLKGGGVVEITCDELGLIPGIFRVDAAMVRRGALDIYDRKPHQSFLKVLPGKEVCGLFHSPHRWRLLSTSGGREPWAGDARDDRAQRAPREASHPEDITKE
jgi:ABC-type polysaccharide/polyol phosphate transport system ATPase subunit